MAQNLVTPFTSEVLRGIADVLGATSGGLTGTEIAHILAQVRVPDTDPTMTKRYRLFNALAARQNHDKAGNCVVAFMTKAMSPIRYRKDQAEFARLQGELNEVLIYASLRITDAGKVARTKGGAATTLDQAAERARYHPNRAPAGGTPTPKLLRYCTTELLQKNNFHALLEAAKSIPDRIRHLTGLKLDGAALVNATLTNKSGPMLAINAGLTSTDLSEQSGFANLMIGLLGLYRNPTAHDPRLHRTVTDDNLLEALTTMSMVHRRLDNATGRTSDVTKQCP